MNNIEPHTRTGLTTVVCLSHRHTKKKDAEKALLVKMKQLSDYAEYLGLWLDYSTTVKENFIHEEV